MNLVCLDLEGVLVPEVWINVAKKTGIEALKRTTRDEPNYDNLMKYRLKLLKENGLKLKDFQKVIQELGPLEGAEDFLKELRREFQLIILSDTFYDFAMPIMEKMNMPTIFCHQLEINDDGEIINYHFRQENQKTHAVKALKGLNFIVFAAGDSFNDLGMLEAAHRGFFYNPPENIKNNYPQFPAFYNYDDLLKAFQNASKEFK